MGIQRKLDDLKFECEKLGINLTSEKRITKHDYLCALAGHYRLIEKEAGRWTSGQEWMFNNIPQTPMLAKAQSYFGNEFMDEVLDSDEWVADVKWDGLRIVVVYTCENGFELFGRNRSVETFFFTNYTNKVLGLEGRQFNFDFVLDTELISINPSINGRTVSATVLDAVATLLHLNDTDSHASQVEGDYPLRFMVFDALYVLDTGSLIGTPLAERLKTKDILMSQLQDIDCGSGSPLFESSKIVGGNKDFKMGLFNTFVGSGVDGIILKKLDGLYNPMEARGGKSNVGWVKLKTKISAEFGKDLDCFITGIVPGKVGSAFEGMAGSVELSVILYPSEEHKLIARVSGIPDSMRQILVIKNSKGELELNPKFKNVVVTIDGQDISSKNHRVMNAVLVRFRDDKSWYDCIVEEAQLNSSVL
jgi:ATP-dependent DNA ligase